MSDAVCRPFRSVLIANRGEIALRIGREARAIGLRAIVATSDADARDWDGQGFEIVNIGGAAPAASYLNGAAIIDAARRMGAEAIHPGYGFLSENDAFARAVVEAGLVWIGPSPAAIAAMADKGAAKAIARQAKVPVIDGYDGDEQSDGKLLAEAKRVGFPVLLKASMGGGGRGQRVVSAEAEFPALLAAARREALSAFGSDRMILERALSGARHIEVQVFGDAAGHVVHMFERDCSVQRRNQKIIEEAPAPGLADATRAAMGEAAVRLARAVNYVNAGTVEFLVEPSGAFYFLEMNTRIQVEHPVTEAVTGLNLIRLQFDVAMGKPLPFAQSDIKLCGHAIEARLCAEDPADSYKPQIGNLAQFDVGDMVRVDKGPGVAVSGHYDSMLAKIIASAPTRDEARAKLAQALSEDSIGGLVTNRGLLVHILEDAAFAQGGVDIGWLSRRAPMQAPDDVMARAAALALCAEAGVGWSSSHGRRFIVAVAHRHQGHEKVSRFAFSAEDVKGNVFHGSLPGIAATKISWTDIHIRTRHREAMFEDVTYRAAARKDDGGDGIVRAPMAGKITTVAVVAGDLIVKGATLATLESMKMEHEIKAAAAGTIKSVNVKAGDQVMPRQILIEITPEKN
ncbi:MAG TPA: biotin carboxylase N-terminal domain-containing protein [Micropepsaceae bacterium]|nr:biotin carboxylase N-terminal domain-containing protein [Micropepsaceae bacterium]